MRYQIDNKDLQDKEVLDGGMMTEQKWHQFTYDKENPFSHHVILRQKKVLDYLKLLNLPKGSKVLELGGGAGQTARKICDLGFDITGIDISKHLCDESEKNVKSMLKRACSIY